MAEPQLCRSRGEANRMKAIALFLGRKVSLFLRIIAGLSIVLAAIFLMISAEMFEHGAVFTFLGYISIIINIVGIVGGILVIIKPSSEFSVALLKLFCLIGLLFVVFFSAVSNEFQSGLTLIIVFWVLAFAYLSSPPVHRFIHPERLRNAAVFPPGTYLKVHAVVPLYFITAAILFILVWVVDWEAQARIYSDPNGGGISSYVSENSRPAITANIDGGFIYNVSSVSALDDDEISPEPLSFSGANFCGEIKVKLTGPSARITLYPFETGVLRLNILNMPRHASLMRNEEDVISGLNISEPRWSGEREVQSTSEQILSGRHLTVAKGIFYDLDVVAGESFTLDIVPDQKPPAEGTFRFVIMSDLHSGYNIFVPEFKEILQSDPDFVIVNGDFTNLGYPSEYMVAAAFTEVLPIPVYSTIGNHDAWNGGSTSYNKYYGPFNYSFVYQNTKFIFLDSSSGIIGENQFEWLIGELESNNSPFLFVISHMPPIDTVTGVFDTSNTLHPESLHTIHSKSESDYLLRLMAQYDVDVFLSGHTHYQGQTVLDGTAYVTSGVLGGTMKPGNNVCYLEVEVGQEDYSIRVKDILSVEEADAKEFENRLQAIRVFSVPFLINNSVRIAATLLLIIIVSLLWILIRRRLIYRLDNPLNHKVDTFVDRKDSSVEDDVR